MTEYHFLPRSPHERATIIQWAKTRKKKSAINRQYLTLIEECIISISRGGTAPEHDKLIATWKDGSRLKSSSRPTKARRMIESLLSEAESDKERKSNLKSISCGRRIAISARVRATELFAF